MLNRGGVVDGLGKRELVGFGAGKNVLASISRHISLPLPPLQPTSPVVLNASPDQKGNTEVWVWVLREINTRCSSYPRTAALSSEEKLGVWYGV